MFQRICVHDFHEVGSVDYGPQLPVMDCNVVPGIPEFMHYVRIRGRKGIGVICPVIEVVEVDGGIVHPHLAFVEDIQSVGICRLGV